MIRFLSSAFLVISFLIQTDCADKYTDENRPYEFGFKIDGQQDRHEKKDKNGIIMGEFGFITADDVYHVTVYATDEQGRFKILSMKNIHLKDTKSVTSARQGHSLQIPSTHKAPAAQVTTTTNQPITQEFQPISLEPPANSCSHCSLPTTSTVAPIPIPPVSSTNANNGYNALANSIGTNVAQKSPVEYKGLTPNIATQQNTVSSLQSTIKSNQPNYAKGLSIQQNSVTKVVEQQGLQSANNPHTQEVNRQYPNYPNADQNYPLVSGTQQNNPTAGQNYPSVFGTQPNYPTAGQNYPSASGTQQNYPTAGQNYLSASGTQQNYPTAGQNYPSAPSIQQNYLRAGQNYPSVSGTQQNNPPQGISGEQGYTQILALEAPGKKIDSQQNYPQNLQSTKSILEPTVEQRNGFNPTQSFAPGFDTSNASSLGTNAENNKFSSNTYNSQAIQHGVEQTPKEISTAVNIPGNRTPKQFNQGEAAPVSIASQKPTLAYAQMQIVDKNTDIHARAPGEKEGLPQGLSKNDMVRLLYTFNYTLGFQGHFEEGYSNGVKQGYYFVTGRNGVRRRIDYTADDTGFHPKISQDVLDLQSDDVPKPDTEKQAKYGLKGYEFKWLYFPVDSKKR